MKANASLLAVGLIGGAAVMYMLSRKAGADRLLPGAEPGAGKDESPDGGSVEKPYQRVIEGGDLFPRYSTAMVSTAKGPVQFEKEFDTDLGEVRWISFKSPNYGSYLNIDRLALNHPPIMIYDRDGGVLWESGRFTLHGQTILGLSSMYLPLSASVV